MSQGENTACRKVNIEDPKTFKKVRRGRAIRNQLENFKIWFHNVRGVKSKINSLRDKIDEVEPSVICIVETHLMDEDDLKFDGYSPPLRNDRDCFGGGILVAVRDEIKNICTVVLKKSKIGEMLWLVIDNGNVKVRLGVIYAPQESRTSKQELKVMYQDIKDQVSQAREKGQKVLIMGDFNAKIGDAVKGNKSEVTKSGKLLLKMAKQEYLTILNTLESCSGTWTRTEGSSRSVLDYILIDTEDEGSVKSMVVDEEKEFSPIGYVDNKITHSDHNVIMAELDWTVMIKNQAKNKFSQVVTKAGLNRVKQELVDKKVSGTIEKEGDMDEVYQEWKNTVNEIWERNTTKVKRKNPRRNIRRLIKIKKHLKKDLKRISKKERKELVGRIKLIDENIEMEKKVQFKKKIGKVVDKLRSTKGINGPGMWEVVNQLKGKKTTPPSAIKNKKGKILEDPNEIKERYLEHFVDLLKPPDASTEEEKKQEEFINMVFEEIMEMAKQQPTRYTEPDEISAAKKELKRRKCKDGSGWCNEVILDGGEEMDQSILKLFNRLEDERMLPSDWKEVIIKTLNKQGTVLEMENKRGLFITDVLSKLYEKVMKKRNNEQVMEYISPYQSGGVLEKATVDCHIILSEIVRRNRKLGKKTYVVFGDAVKCFDKLWLRDALVEMYKAGCNMQDIQLMYKLNEETGIVVDTPLGKTERAVVGEIVKQGTVLGPQLCCVETDQINKIGENQEKMVGEQMVGILVFVDDVMSAGTAEDIKKAIRNFGAMETFKKFTYGLKKTNYMIMKTGRENDEEIHELVKEGEVKRVEEYNCIGLG